MLINATVDAAEYAWAVYQDEFIKNFVPKKVK
jgi:hypothetical protein